MNPSSVSDTQGKTIQASVSQPEPPPFPTTHFCMGWMWHDGRWDLHWSEYGTPNLSDANAGAARLATEGLCNIRIVTIPGSASPPHPVPPVVEEPIPEAERDGWKPTIKPEWGVDELRERLHGAIDGSRRYRLYAGQMEHWFLATRRAIPAKMPPRCPDYIPPDVSPPPPSPAIATEAAALVNRPHGTGGATSPAAASAFPEKGTEKVLEWPSDLSTLVGKRIVTRVKGHPERMEMVPLSAGNGWLSSRHYEICADDRDLLSISDPQETDGKKSLHVEPTLKGNGGNLSEWLPDDLPTAESVAQSMGSKHEQERIDTIKAVYAKWRDECSRLSAGLERVKEATKGLLDIIHDDLTHARQRDHKEAIDAAKGLLP